MRRTTGGEFSSRSSEFVEDENSRLVEGLKLKTSALKSLSIDIGHEIREQKKLLDDMDSDFDRTTGFLSSTVNRVGRMLKSGYNRYILYLIMFSLFVFFLIYVIIRFR